MSFSINNHVRSVNDPPIGEVQAWAACRPEGAPALIDLCQAVPDYALAAELLEHLQQVVRDPLTCRYTPDEGLPEVREAVCGRYRRRYRAAINSGQICLTVGASQAFWLAMLVLCHAGDEVILQSPCYFDHPIGSGGAGDQAGFCSVCGKGAGDSQSICHREADNTTHPCHCAGFSQQSNRSGDLHQASERAVFSGATSPDRPGA